MTLELSIFIVVVFIVWIAYCLGYDKGHYAGHAKGYNSGVYHGKRDMLRKKVANISLTEFYEEMEKLEKEHEQRI